MHTTTKTLNYRSYTMLNYTPLSKEQDKLRNVFPAGKYPFTVKGVEEKYCKNKINKMLVVELSVINPENKHLTVTDWIMLDIEGMEWKLRHFCDATGLIDKYDSKTLSIKDIENKFGIVKLTIGEYDRNGETVKVNRVADYLVKDAAIADKDLFNDALSF